MRRRIVICGSGLAGLVAARAFANCFEEVTLLDARSLGPGGKYNHPVVQAQHVHHLLRRAMEQLLSYFPHLRDTLLANGAVELDYSADIAVFGGQGRYPSRKFDLTVVAQSRQLLDDVLFAEVRSISNVHVYDATKVLDMNVERGLVSRVNVRRGGQVLPLDADVVLDCTGAGLHKDWHPLSYRATSASAFKCEVGIHYVSIRARQSALASIGSDAKGLIIPPVRKDSRFLIAMPIEADLCLLTFGGKKHDLPQLSKSPLDFLADLCREHGVHLDVPVPSATYRLCQPTLYWRRPQNVAAMPRNLFPVGDSMCVLSPFASQGMSLAINHVINLSRILREPGPLSDSQRAYFNQVDLVTRPCWAFALAREPTATRIETGNIQFEAEIRQILELERRAYSDPLVHFQYLMFRQNLGFGDMSSLIQSLPVT